MKANLTACRRPLLRVKYEATDCAGLQERGTVPNDAYQLLWGSAAGEDSAGTSVFLRFAYLKERDELSWLIV